MAIECFNWLLSISGGFLGSKYRLWHIVEVMQVVAVLFFINIRSYALNNDMMFNYMLYSNLYLLPNPLQQQTQDYRLSLRRFKYAGLTYYTLNNSGGRFLFYGGISVLIYLSVKAVYNKYIVKILEIFIDKLEFSYLFKFYEIFLLDLLINSFHNIKYSSMDSNWEGTNTVVAFITLILIAIMEVIKLLVLLFKERFGTPEEVDVMFATLYDGYNEDAKWRRIIISLIAYAIIYMDNDPFALILMIIVPRGSLLLIMIGTKIL